MQWQAEPGARRKRTGARVTLGAVLSLGMAFAAEAATFNITLADLSGLTDSQKNIFTQAENAWESIIIGYNAAITSTFVTGVTIYASGVSIDGVGGILGQAGPDYVYNPALTAGFVMTYDGVMQFDSADLANLESTGVLLAVIEHEMAHVLGFGTLWPYNGLYVDGSGQYTGANALAAYRAEFNQPGATYVPVELGGGPGAANGHWDEVNGGSTNTGIVDGSGRDLKNELMTGWLSPPTFLSNTTIQQFVDLGYQVAVVPAPAAVLLFGSAVGGLGFLRARQRDGSAWLPRRPRLSRPEDRAS